MKLRGDTAGCVHVLAVSPFESDHVALTHIFGHSAWRLDGARTLKEARAKLPGSQARVVLCEERLPDGSWKDFLLPNDSTPESIQLIVTSQQPDERLWAEVLNLGAYDVLAKPFHAKEVYETIGQAWRHSMSCRKSPARAHGESKSLIAGAVA
jgi:DNA-binding NtrC family response regulator